MKRVDEDILCGPPPILRDKPLIYFPLGCDGPELFLKASEGCPAFALSGRTDAVVREYRQAGWFAEINPPPMGRPSQADRTILIYAISVMVYRCLAGGLPHQSIRMNVADLLTTLHRNDLYPNLEQEHVGLRWLNASLLRLTQSEIVTEAMLGEAVWRHHYPYLESAGFGQDGTELWIRLSEWMYRGLLARGVVSGARAHFAIHHLLGQRLYEFACRFCKPRNEARYALQYFHRWCGSTAKPGEFRTQLQGVLDLHRRYPNLPDFRFELDGGMLAFRKLAPRNDIGRLLSLSPERRFTPSQ
ncbi:MAG: replication initiator protein A [Burkholderiaceae bacterium]